MNVKNIALIMMAVGLGCCWGDSSANEAPAKTQELPLDVFFGNSDISQLRISPNGRYLASLRPFNKRMQVVVVDLETNTSKRLTDMKDENVMSVRWLKDERLLFAMQSKGQESVGLYAVNADGTNLTIVRQATTVDENGELDVAGSRENIIDYLSDDPNEVLIGMVRGNSGLSDIYRMNIHKEKRVKLVCQNPGKVRRWITDANAVPRIGISQDEHSLDYTILYRSNEKDAWRPLASFKQDDPSWSPLGFDADNKTLFVTSNLGRSTYSLWRYDPETNKMLDEVVADETYDVGTDAYGFSGGLIYSPTGRKVLGVSYLADRPKTVWFDPAMKRMQADIDRLLPDTANTLSSTTKDMQKVLVVASSDRDPGTYYLFNREKMELMELLKINSKVDPSQMAPMESVSYKARDGMLIHAFLTKPKNPAGKKLPLVVLPHGGPYGPRDQWGFDAEAQFLANRGYVVLQPNFRGSGGYGEEYERAGYKQWGLKMQDDLTDGALWLIEQGLVDRDRVGIYGASYGGYAAMMGIIKEPQLFRCAVNYVGVTDISILFEGYASYPLSAKESIERRFGHPVKDKKYQEDNSPLNLVSKIQAPVLMAYGFFDPRVTLEHGAALYKEMIKQGKDVEYIVSKNEGHGFGRVENRLGFYKAMDEFFRKNLNPIQGKVSVGETKVIQMPVKE